MSTLYMFPPNEKPTEDAEILAGEYALGVMDPGEAAATRLRADADPALLGAIGAWQARLVPMTEMLVETPPPPELWARLAVDIGMRQPEQEPARSPPRATDKPLVEPAVPEAGEATADAIAEPHPHSEAPHETGAVPATLPATLPGAAPGAVIGAVPGADPAATDQPAGDPATAVLADYAAAPPALPPEDDTLRFAAPPQPTPLSPAPLPPVDGEPGEPHAGHEPVLAVQPIERPHSADTQVALADAHPGTGAAASALAPLPPAAAPASTAFARLSRPADWQPGPAMSGTKTATGVGLFDRIGFWRAATAASLALALGIAAYAFLTRPGTAQAIAAIGVVNAPAPIYLAEADAKGMLRVTPLAVIAVPNGRDLQLWMIPPGTDTPVSLGVISPGGQTVSLGGPPAEGTRLIVSMEPRGGSTGRITGQVLYGGTLANR